MMLFGWLLIGLFLYYIMKDKEPSAMNYTNRITPEDLLKERFAKGEIDEETFEKMKRTLNQS